MLQLHLTNYILIGMFYENGELKNPFVLQFTDFDRTKEYLANIKADFADEKGKFELHISESDAFDSYATFKGEDGRNYRWEIVRRNISINV